MVKYVYMAEINIMYTIECKGLYTLMQDKNKGKNVM